jgi:hypothetical protein
MIFRSFDIERAAGDRAGAIDHHFAHRRADRTPADSRKLMKPTDDSPRCFEFGPGVDAEDSLRSGSDIGLGRHCNAIEPGQRLLDLLDSNPTDDSLRVSWSCSGQASGRQ